MRPEVNVIVTRKRYVTLRHPKMHPHTKFGIPSSKNLGDMHRTGSGTTDSVITTLTQNENFTLYLFE